MRRLLVLLSIFCLLPVVSCAPIPSNRDWAYADLRLLDPLDAPTPSTDILAVYTRAVGSDLELRVDLLDISIIPDYDLALRITTPTGDLTVTLPAGGRPSVTPATPAIIPRLVRDPWLDTVTVRFNRLGIPRPFTLQVKSFTPGDSTPADETESVRSDALPPAQRAPVLLAFWNVFPAATPAQALRRWDGAHTGPQGGRHGLRYILDNAGQFGIPVALLDVKTPASLAALDYMGVMPQLQALTSRSLLLLPDVAFAEPADISLVFSRRAAAGFGLPASQFVYNASASFQSDYLAQFYPLDDASHLSRSGGTRLIPLPTADAVQATQDGPSLAVRKALMDAALSTDPSDLVALGGDLPHSTWGNENAAASTFAWIAAHPWIQPLTGEDLMAFPVGATNTKSLPTPIEPWKLLADYHPGQVLTDLAWQTYLTLHVPDDDSTRRSLRAHYVGQVGSLLAAAHWAANPSAYPSEDNDINKYSDGEYSLSSESFFAIINNRESGAVLTNLFYLNDTGPHQLVGPSSQFTVGLSDPSEWKLELGEAADPSVIPGAFSDGTTSWTVYRPTITTDSITFTTPDGSRVKTYQLLENGIEITYQGSGPVSTRIPLAVDPQAFYFGSTEYTGSLAPGAWTWGLVNGIRVEVSTGATLSVQSFTDSFPYLSQPEDPDRAYPGGHYLPFPLSVPNLQGSGNFSIQIIVK